MTLIPITERTQYCFVDCGKEICRCKPTKKILMNKEKTAMQMLIELMEADVKDESNVRARIEIRTWIIESKKLLQKEQEQIERAFDSGIQCGMTKGYQNVGKDYYQSKYGGEDVYR